VRVKRVEHGIRGKFQIGDFRSTGLAGWKADAGVGDISKAPDNVRRRLPKVIADLRDVGLPPLPVVV